MINIPRVHDLAGRPTQQIQAAFVEVAKVIDAAERWEDLKGDWDAWIGRTLETLAGAAKTRQRTRKLTPELRAKVELTRDKISPKLTALLNDYCLRTRQAVARQPELMKIQRIIGIIVRIPLT
jgi:hypothetical protein